MEGGKKCGYFTLSLFSSLTHSTHIYQGVTGYQVLEWRIITQGPYDGDNQ